MSWAMERRTGHGSGSSHESSSLPPAMQHETSGVPTAHLRDSGTNVPEVAAVDEFSDNVRTSYMHAEAQIAHDVGMLQQSGVGGEW